MSQQEVHPPRRPSQTKIVATVGPACGDHSRLVELILAGVDVFRVNTAHGSREEHQRRVDDVREAGRSTGRVVGLLVDLGQASSAAVHDSALALKATWSDHWSSMPDERASADAIVASIDAVRAEVQALLASLQ